MSLKTVLLTLAPVLLMAASCSTVRDIPEGSSRLTANVVNVTGGGQYPDFRDSEVSSYIIQKPNSYFFKGEKGGWNPFIAVYGWGNGRGGAWDRFVHKIGQKPVVLDSALVLKSNENITRHLEYLGWYGSSVRGVIVPKGGKKAYVRYDVSPGKRYPISSVSYDICDSLLSADYLSDTASLMIKRGACLSESLLEEESARAAGMLKDKGWYDFSKNYFFFEADTTVTPDSAEIMVSIRRHTRNESGRSDIDHRKFRFGRVFIYPVSDDVRYRTALAMKIPQVFDTLRYGGVNILYDGRRCLRPDVVTAINTIIPGDTYSDETVNTTYHRYTSIRSFSSVSVQTDKTDSSTVDCSVILLPHKKHGYKLELESSLNASGLFGIAPAVSYFNRNLFHGGEWLDISAKGNFQFKFHDPTRAVEVGIAAGLSFPDFKLLPETRFRVVVPRSDINLTYNYQQRPEFTRNMIGASYGYSWSTLSGKWNFKLNPLQANIVKMSDVSEEFTISMSQNPTLQARYESHFELGCGVSVNYASVQGLNPKVSNLKASFSMDIAGNILSAFNRYMPSDSAGTRRIWGTPYSQFVRSEGSVTYTHRFGRDLRQALAGRLCAGAGFAYGNSTSLPYERQFWVGGANSMRGWQAKSLGPGGFPYYTGIFEIPSQTGDVRIEANLEYRFPLVWKLEGALFADWGNVWDRKPYGLEAYDDMCVLSWGTLFERSALDSGFGLRVDLSMVVVRLDVGIKLYDPECDPDKLDKGIEYIGWRPVNRWFASDGFAIQFGIGYPF